MDRQTENQTNKKMNERKRVKLIDMKTIRQMTLEDMDR